MCKYWTNWKINGDCAGTNIRWGYIPSVRLILYSYAGWCANSYGLTPFLPNIKILLIIIRQPIIPLSSRLWILLCLQNKALLQLFNEVICACLKSGGKAIVIQIFDRINFTVTLHFLDRWLELCTYLYRFFVFPIEFIPKLHCQVIKGQGCTKVSKYSVS